MSSKLCLSVLVSEFFDRRTKEQKADNNVLKIMPLCSYVGIFLIEQKRADVCASALFLYRSPKGFYFTKEATNSPSFSVMFNLPSRPSQPIAA